MESSLTFLGRLGHYAHNSHKILRRKYEKKVSGNFAIVSLLLKITYKCEENAPIYRWGEGLKRN